MTSLSVVAAVTLIATVALMVVPPHSEAYDILLTQWNTSQLESAGDRVKVTIAGTTITFTFLDGDGVAPDPVNVLSIFWSNAVVTAAGAATGTGDYADIDDNGTNSSKWTNADGFGKFRVEVDDSEPSKNKTLTVTFTFANNLDGTNFTASDFALHVQYTNGCSGYVSGTDIVGSSSSSCAVATVVPEPITAFLGGTALLLMGYLGRRRLLGRAAH
jgi:hypothetical protein